jgi:hypothetical protein
MPVGVNAENCLILGTMRDVIWTIIIIWLLFRMADLVKSWSKKTNQDSGLKTPPPENPPKKDLKEALRRHVNSEGEYVDYEEIR